MNTGSYLELLLVGIPSMYLGDAEPPLGQFILTIIVNFELLQSRLENLWSATMLIFHILATKIMSTK